MATHQARIREQNGGYARDYLRGFAWLVGRDYGPARERPSVCLCIGALEVNDRICRIGRVGSGAIQPMPAVSLLTARTGASPNIEPDQPDGTESHRSGIPLL
jgi:hypothetical protein